MIIYYENLKNKVKFYNGDKVLEMEKNKDLIRFLRALYHKKIKMEEIKNESRYGRIQ